MIKMKSRIEKFYPVIPAWQKKYILDFAKGHAPKTLRVDGVPWEYYDSKNGREALLLLHGGYSDFSMWMHQIIAFENTFRIIAPTCPALPHASMQHYAVALRTILKAEKISSVNIIGYSEGGIIAQVFLRNYPSLVNKVVLGHTFYPSRESRYYKNDFRLFKVLPACLTEFVFRSLAKPDKEEIEHASSEWLPWYQGWFKELKSNLTKDLIITHIDLMTDFVRNYTFDANDLSEWDGQMLITVAEDDIVFNYFEGLKQLYPHAECHVFKKGLGAHSLALISPAIFNQRIADFLEK